MLESTDPQRCRASLLYGLMRAIVMANLHGTGFLEIRPHEASPHEATGHETSPLEANPNVTSAHEASPHETTIHDFS